MDENIFKKLEICSKNPRLSLKNMFKIEFFFSKYFTGAGEFDEVMISFLGGKVCLTDCGVFGSDFLGSGWMVAVGLFDSVGFNFGRSLL